MYESLRTPGPRPLAPGPRSVSHLSQNPLKMRHKISTHLCKQLKNNLLQSLNDNSTCPARCVTHRPFSDLRTSFPEFCYNID